MDNYGLVPLRNFAVIDEEKGIYRSAQPLYTFEYEWLNKVLKIKTIVNLRAERDHDSMIINHLGLNITVVNITVVDHHPPTIEQCHFFQQLIKNNEGFPLLFHCEHGHGRTSTFCILARLALGWKLEDALKEEEEKFHYSFQHHAQKEFLIKNFENQ